MSRIRGKASAVPRPLWAGTAVALFCVVFPLASAPWAADPTSALRILVLGAGLAAGLMATRARLTLPTTVWWASGASLSIFALAALFSPTPILGLLGRFPRYEGLPWLLSCVVVAGIAARLASSSAARRALRWSLLTTSSVMAASSLIETLARPGFRIVTPLGNASDAAALAVVCLAVGALWLSGWHRTWVVLTAALTVLLSASRGALLAALLVLAVAAVMNTVAGKDGGEHVAKGWVQPTATGFALAAAALVLPMTRRRVLGESALATATVDGRLALWSDTVSLWMSQPWVGAGPSRFVDDINRHHGQAWAATLGEAAPPDSPHNVVLQILASGGLLGLLAATGLMAAVCTAWWRHRGDMLVRSAFLATLGVASFGLTHLTNPSYLLPLVVVVGMSLGSEGPGSRTVSQRSRTLTIPAVVSAMFVVVILAAGSWLLVAESALGRAAARASAGHPEAAEAVIAAVQTMPDNPDFVRRAAHVLIELGWSGAAEPEPTLGLLAGTCPSLPESVECMRLLAAAQEQSGELNTAAGTLDQLLAEAPANPEVMLQRAIVAAQLGQLKEAEERLLDLSRLQPSAVAPWENLVLVYELMGDHQAREAAEFEVAERHR